MSREIKFRAWDKENNKWYTPTHKAYKGDLWELLVNFGGQLDAWTLDVNREGTLIHESRFPDRYILMQYTGLKDKNGKEIYEGDILERIGTTDNFTQIPKDSRFLVSKELIVVSIDVTKDEFGKQSIGFAMNTERSYSERGNPATYEIVGNIYESPELLKSKTKQST